MSDAVIRAVNISREFNDGDSRIRVLREVNVEVFPGEMLAIVGQSGSGKSTLLQLLGGLDAPTVGQIYWRQQAIASLGERARCRLRNEHIGFVYQFHHLLPEFTALENVAMPLLIGKKGTKMARGQAETLLAQVGLADRISHKPSELSGGERQRVALARALAMNPSCILADEPTGNLDNDTGRQVFDALLTLMKTHGTSVVMVTHDMTAAARAHRVLQLVSGALTSLERRTDMLP